MQVTITKRLYCSFLTSTCVRRLFWFGPDTIGIQKMRSKFFERSKRSGVTGTQPAGCGGGGNKLKMPVKYGKRFFDKSLLHRTNGFYVSFDHNPMQPSTC